MSILYHAIVALWLPLALFFLLRRQSNIVRQWFGLGLIWMVMFLTTFFAGNEVGLIVIFLFIILIFLKVFKSRMIQLISIPISYISIVICDYVVHLLYFQITGIGEGQIFSRKLFKFWSVCAITIMVIIVSVVLEKLFYIIGEIHQSKRQKEVYLLIGGNISLCTVAFLVIGWETRKISITKPIAVTTMLILVSYMVLTLIISFFLFKVQAERGKIEREKQQYESLLEYTRQIEAMYTNLRTFKHDYVNILATLSGYLDEKDYTGLEEYFNNNILPESKKFTHDNYRLNQLSNIKDRALKGLLSSKLMYAHEAGIEVYIDILEQVDSFFMNIFDLTRIMGIFLDNAIEAACECEKKVIRFNVVKQEHSVTMILMNTFKKREVSIGKIEEYGFSTKGENRGLGLYNVKEILKKYDQVYKSTSLEDEFFVQTLVME